MVKFVTALKPKRKAKHLLLYKIVHKFQIPKHSNMSSSPALSTLIK